MNEIPLWDASMSEVLARVAYRMIVRDYHAYPEPYSDPRLAMGAYARWLDKTGWSTMAMWVRSYCIQWTPLTPARWIRDGYCIRARSGYTWRAVAYPAYKANRADDPRVTNRGVIWSGRKRRWQ